MPEGEHFTLKMENISESQPICNLTHAPSNSHHQQLFMGLFPSCCLSAQPHLHLPGNQSP